MAPNMEEKKKDIVGMEKENTADVKVDSSIWYDWTQTLMSESVPDDME